MKHEGGMWNSGGKSDGLKRKFFVSVNFYSLKSEKKIRVFEEYMSKVLEKGVCSKLNIL